MTNRVLAQIPLTVGPVGLQTHPVIILFWEAQSEQINYVAESPHRVCYGEKVQVEATLLICLVDTGGNSGPTTVSFY